MIYRVSVNTKFTIWQVCIFCTYCHPVNLKFTTWQYMYLGLELGFVVKILFRDHTPRSTSSVSGTFLLHMFLWLKRIQKWDFESESIKVEWLLWYLNSAPKPRNSYYLLRHTTLYFPVCILTLMASIHDILYACSHFFFQLISWFVWLVISYFIWNGKGLTLD